MSNKRRRIGDNHQSSYQSTSFSASHDLINPTSDHFEQLPSVLFAHVCTFLDLKCKCWRLPVLSHRVNTAFEPALSCREHLSLKFVANLDDTSDPEEDEIMVSSVNVHSVAPYLRNASSIEIEWLTSETDDVVFDCVNNELSQRLSRCNLVGLSIFERISSNPRAIAFILTCLQHAEPSQLASLQALELYMNISEGDSTSDHMLDWNGLSNCQALECLTLGIGSPLVSHAEQAMILNSLPNSLLHLEVTATEGKDNFPPFKSMLCERLCDPLFLPYLISYQGDRFEEPKSCLIRGLTTVMTETGQMRPFEDLPGFPIDMTDQWVPFTWASQLQAVTLELSETSLALFAGQSDDVLHVLKLVEITLVMSEESANVAPLDLSDLFIFMSKRPVEDITLTLNPYSQRQHNSQRRKCCSLSLLAMQHFTMLDILQSFHVIVDEVLFESNLFANVEESINCWPELKYVDTTGAVWGPDNIVSLFKAAPKLANISCDVPLQWSALLPLISYYCPNIVYLWDRDRPRTVIPHFTRHVTLVALEKAFSMYPPTTNSFQKLQHLRFGYEHFDTDALHFFCSQLASAPLLTSFASSELSISLFELCIVLSKLQRLKSIPGRTNVQTILALLDPEDARFFKTHKNKRGGVETTHLTPNFCTMFDTPPLDGRKYLLDKALTLLSDEELALLEQWDADDYS